MTHCLVDLDAATDAGTEEAAHQWLLLWGDRVRNLIIERTRAKR